MGVRHALLGEGGGGSSSPYIQFLDGGDSANWRVGQTTEGLINQSTNGHEEYLTINITPDETTDYIIETSFVWSLNVTNDNFNAEFLVENVTLGTTPVKYPFLDLESKDAAGAGTVLNVITNDLIIGNASSSTDARTSTSSILLLNLTSGEEYNISLSWRSQTINDEATIYKGNLSIKKS